MTSQAESMKQKYALICSQRCESLFDPRVKPNAHFAENLRQKLHRLEDRVGLLVHQGLFEIWLGAAKDRDGEIEWERKLKQRERERQRDRERQSGIKNKKGERERERETQRQY